VQCYVAFDGDSIGAAIGRHVLADDVESVRRISRQIEAGEDIWRSFATRVGGNTVESGGDEGVIQIPATKLSDVPDVARQYALTVGATVSVGVGMKIGEAARALLVSKLRGKNQINIWDPSMQSEIDAATSQPKAESDKLAAEYLNKAQPEKGSNKQDNLAGHPRHDKQKGMSGDHEEGAEAAKEVAAAKDEEISPEMTHAADNFEDQLHDLAAQQGQKDQQDAQQSESHLDEVKQQLVQALQTVRQNMPVIQPLQQSAPEVYQSLMALTQGLVALGREVVGQTPDDEPPGEPDPVKKAEELEKSVAQIQAGARSLAPGRVSFDYSHHLPEGARQKGLTMTVTHVKPAPGVGEHMVTQLMQGPTRVGSVTAYLHKQNDSIEPHSDLAPEFKGQGLGSAMYEATYAHAKNKLGMTMVSGGLHSMDAHKLHNRLAAKHGFEYRGQPVEDKFHQKWGFTHDPYQYALKDEEAMSLSDDEVMKADVLFEKGGAEGGAEAGRQHLDLPDGTIHDGQVKVRHADGTSGWKHVNAGMIQGQEADAPLLGANSHPVSSRAPSSK
jgi:GNAT superfamily N-acetyltransferase